MTRIAEEIGSQSVVVVLDVKRAGSDEYEVWTHNGRGTRAGKCWNLPAKSERSGAGEIVVNSSIDDGDDEGLRS